jgi:translation initiation factor IF-1
MTAAEASLAREADSLQKQIEALKYAKSGMPEAEYEKKLEDLLVRLAQVNSKMRKK